MHQKIVSDGVKFLLCLMLCGVGASECAAQTNPYAPQRTKREKPEKKKRERTRAERDTVPRYGKGSVDLRASVVFPVQYFAESEPGNPDAGFAAQGFGFGAGRFFPFRKNSPVGAYFGLGYARANASAMIPYIQSLLDAHAAGDDNEAFSTAEGFRPRYVMIPATFGLAYEGSGSTAVYARFLFHMVRTSMNEIEAVSENNMRRTAETEAAISTGIGMEFGLRFSEVLRAGLSWQYFGRPEMSVSTGSEELPSSVFRPLEQGRPVSVLQVNLAYSFDRTNHRRKGKRIRR